MDFRNKVLIIGYGAVSKCTLPILLRHVTIPLENITIIDFKNKAGIKQPLEAANAGIVSAYGINSYPALIRIKEDEYEIQEGF